MNYQEMRDRALAGAAAFDEMAEVMRQISKMPDDTEVERVVKALEQLDTCLVEARDGCERIRRDFADVCPGCLVGSMRDVMDGEAMMPVEDGNVPESTS